MPPTKDGGSSRDAGFARDGGPLRDAGTERDGGVAERDGGVIERDGGEPDSGARDGGSAAPPVVIVMIGDGMGFPQVETAGQYQNGASGTLAMEQLPVRGEIRTASLSGLTDSAASATAMATGVKTTNRHVGVDVDEAPLETSVELAHQLQMPAGIVSTAHLSHATPASFSAHWRDRDGFGDIAASLATVRPEVMLGGGTAYLGAHVADLTAAGWAHVTRRSELLALDPSQERVLGLFADEHLDYVIDRTTTSSVPSLAEMSMAAIQHLDAPGRGFFLMIEGARIDMAAHINDRDRMITETVDFDEAIAAVDAWARTRPNVTLIVTGDHECGGVEITTPGSVGVFPEITWRWDQHTNQRIGVYARGPQTEVFDQTVQDNTMVYAVTRAALTGQPLVDPTPALVVDGHVGDLTHRVADQVVTTGFGDGINQLDALYVDADEDRLAVGVEGLFEWERNALVLLVDVDYGAGTGIASLEGALTDTEGRVDSILSSLTVRAPTANGFGADAAIAIWGGTVLRDENLIGDAGWRGFANPANLAWEAISTNWGDRVRTRTMKAAEPGEGWEVHVPWYVLYPGAGGNVPAGATIAVAAVLVNDDGGFLSNQALPPFAPGTMNPGRMGAALPGIVTFTVDANSDGVAGDLGTPVVVP